MFPALKNQIWYYPKAIDFRKGLRGLVELIALDLNQNPGSGDVYVFRSKRLNQIKMVFWQHDGFWLCQKKMEKKRFQFPVVKQDQLNLSAEQFNWLLSGLHIIQAPKPIEPPTCYG